MNARKMGLAIADVDLIVFSHGHNDHTWGIKYLVEQELKNKSNKPKLVAHPHVFDVKICDGEEIGIGVSKDALSQTMDVILTEEPLWISNNLVFLGEIERTNKFENTNPIGKRIINGSIKDDFLMDDSALVYKAKEGLVIITGCSHSGICNIIEYARKVCNEKRVLDIIGGFHLLSPDKEQIENTIDYLKKIKTRNVYASHCTDLKSKIRLSHVVNIQEVGVGLSLEYE